MIPQHSAFSPSDLPWQDPVASYAGREDDEPVADLLHAGAAAGATLFVLGAGFDPRCTSGLRLAAQLLPTIAVLALDLTPPSGAAPIPALARRRDENGARIRDLAGASLQTVPFPAVHDTTSVGRIFARDVNSAVRDGDYRHVIVDVSAMPTRTSFPILKTLLNTCAEAPGSPELQVIVAENPELDGQITKAGIDEAQLIAGFARPLNREKSPDQIRAWIPILGRGSDQALRKVHEFISPEAVHPVLPFPARDPRLPDDLVIEHRMLLVDTLEVRPQDYLYADERNPFDLFRSLVRFAREYRHTLLPVGEAVVALSCHASKLLALGALLAAYTEQLPVVAAIATDYELDDAAFEETARENDQLSCLWLRGTPYRLTD